MTSDKYAWAMWGFSYLFNRYWSEQQDVIVGCYKPSSFRLPDNFHSFQIDKRNYPADRWSDGLIKLLSTLKDPHVIIMLEDYWLCRTVDVRGVATLYEYMCQHQNILRFDLTDDRLYAGGMYDVEAWGSYDIIETPERTPYQLSLQTAIWNREMLLSLLVPNKSAWEVEIHTSPPSEMRVLGSRQSPVRYANLIYKGSVDRAQLNRIPEEHREIVRHSIPLGLSDR